MRRFNIRAVVFDLGNVLVNFDHKIAVEKISAFTDKSPQEIYDLFFTCDITRFFEEGKISPADFFFQVKRMLNLKADYTEFLPIWNEIFFLTEENKQVYRLAETLKDKYKTALLTNTDILHFEYLRRNFKLFNPFCHILASFELGMVKPNPLIYKKALETLKVSPEEAFYTDDRKELISAANNLGINGYVYTKFDQLKKDLLGCGVSF